MMLNHIMYSRLKRTLKKELRAQLTEKEEVIKKM